MNFTRVGAPYILLPEALAKVVGGRHIMKITQTELDATRFLRVFETVVNSEHRIEHTNKAFSNHLNPLWLILKVLK